MPKQWMRSVLLIITYTVLLVLGLMRSDWIFGLLGQILSGCRPLFIGFAIAFILNRPCAFFCRHYERNLGKRWRKLGRPLAVLTSYLALIAVIVALFSFVLPQVVESIRMLAGSLGGYIANLQTLLNQAADYLDWEAVDLDLSSLNQYLREFLNGVLTSVSNAATQVVMVTGNIISMFVTLVLAVVFSIYMLAGKEKLLSQGRRLLRAYLPERWADRVSDVIQLTADIFSSFVSGQLIEACILGGLCALGTLFIQPDYAALIGVIIGVSALIPVAGAYVGAILSAFLLVMVNPVRALIFLIFLAVLQQIEGNVIYPRVVGTSIGLPGIWVLAAVTVGGGLFGPAAGMAPHAPGGGLHAHRRPAVAADRAQLGGNRTPGRGAELCSRRRCQGRGDAGDADQHGPGAPGAGMRRRHPDLRPVRGAPAGSPPRDQPAPPGPRDHLRSGREAHADL